MTDPLHLAILEEMAGLRAELARVTAERDALARRRKAPRRAGASLRPGRPGWGCWPTCTVDHGAVAATSSTTAVDPRAAIRTDGATPTVGERLQRFAVDRHGGTAELPQRVIVTA